LNLKMASAGDSEPRAEVGAVFLTAVQAVIQVLLLASAGAALELTGQLGKAKRGGLSNIAFRILLPCLMFSSVTETVSARALARLYIVPLYAGAILTIGAILGKLTAPFALPAKAARRALTNGGGGAADDEDEEPDFARVH
jgi:predicted permease